MILGLLAMPLLAIFQSTLLPYLNLHGEFNLDLVLVIVLSWNLAYPESESLLWALLGGLMLDSLSGAHMGINIISLTLASLIANLAGSRVWSTHIILRISVGIIGTIIYYLVYILLLTITGWTTDWANLPIDNLVRSIIINVFIIILIVPTARWLAEKLTKRSIDI